MISRSIHTYYKFYTPVRYFVSQPPQNKHDKYYRQLLVESQSKVASMSEMAAKYANSLKFRAATILAESLDSSERSKLLDSIDAVDQNLAEENTRKSIGEAVAKAMQEESLKKENRWEEERVQIEKKAEEAAILRMMTEMKLKVQNDKNNDSNIEHPILGTVVKDLQYKKIYCVPVEQLETIPVWEKQRSYRHGRAKAMAKDKLKQNGIIGLPGIIALYEDRKGQLSILDGQHRVGMLSLLRDKVKERDGLGDRDAETIIDYENILVEVFSENMKDDNANTKKSSKSYANELFTEINKAEPVKLVDMPGHASDMDRQIINEGVTQLQKSFSGMFKESQRCRPPHLNIDNLRDALFTAEILKTHSIKSSEGLIKWILGRNNEMKRKYRRTLMDLEENKAGDEKKLKVGGGRKINKIAVQKAFKFDFFLGLDNTWLA